MSHGDYRLNLRGNIYNKALRILERLRIRWDIDSTHVEINDLILSVICFCVFCFVFLWIYFINVGVKRCFVFYGTISRPTAQLSWVLFI